MTTVHGFAQLGNTIGRQVESFSKNIRSVEVAGTKDVAATVVAAVTAHLGGNPITLRNVGKGAKVGVIARPDFNHGQSMVVKMTGPAHLIERSIKPHTILGRSVGRLGKGKGSRSAAAKHAAKQALYDALFGGTGGGHMKIGGEWRTGPFQHPGVKDGKHPFERGVREVEPEAVRIYDRGVQVALRRSFSG